MDNIILEKNTNFENELSMLQKELAEYKHKCSSQKEELLVVNEQLHEKSSKLSFHEMENESLRRIIDRLHVENDQLLQKFDSVSKAARILEENENALKDELKSLKEETKNLRTNVLESNLARDNVIEKLKNVSLETRELIDNCEKASDETELFKIKSEELGEELKKLHYENDSFQSENRNLKLEIESKNVEIMSLQKALSSFNHTETNGFWMKDVSIANNGLRDIEWHIKKILDKLRCSEDEKRMLDEEIERLRINIIILQKQEAVKDEIISEQRQEFQKVKTTVDDYHSEILRLDAELKDCHKRVSALNGNLEILNSEHINLVEYSNFKRCLNQFGNVENIENLLTKLLVLQEIEQFFEKKLSPHVNPSDRDPTDTDPIVTDCKQNTINKIKSYLEKALVTIEKLNDKMLRLKAEYESKLRSKSAEISTLREVLSNATLYNKILEQALEQCKDNIQLDKTIENKTDELLTANETLLDSFDELKELYKMSERCSTFFCVKSKQLQLCYRLLKLITTKWIKSNEHANDDLEQKLNGLFFLIDEIFEDIHVNGNDGHLSMESQQILNKCEKKLITKDYLKSTVESMSQEVKRLTYKVENEMAEKGREIELLKGEMDVLRTDNCELVGKIKNCNREIVSLSTENYDLNEKLENLSKVEVECMRSLQHNILDVGDATKAAYPEDFRKNVEYVNRLCIDLKKENANLKQTVLSFSRELIDALIPLKGVVKNENQKIEPYYLKNLMSTCRALSRDNNTLKQSVIDLKSQVQENLIALKKLGENVKCSSSNKDMEVKLKNLMDLCNEMRKQQECLKKLNFKSLLENMVLCAKSNAEERLRAIIIDFDKVANDLNSITVSHESYKSDVSSYLSRVSSTLKEMKTLNNSIHSYVEEQMVQFINSFDPLKAEIQNAVSYAFANMKSSLALSNEEIIKEMQEMNTELKIRGATISNLNQVVNELKNEKCQLLNSVKEKEIMISAAMEKTTNYDKVIVEKEISIQTVQQELEQTISYYKNEIDSVKKMLENSFSEVEDLKYQIGLKDEMIISLENEITKHKDGDTSSMGTMSRTEEVSRLNDVEDSFEERYMKLRCIAVKMKKNIAELNQQLTNEKTERTILQNKLSLITEQAKRNQVLQEECDKLTDEVELHQSEVKELKKIILESDKSIEKWKLRCNELSKNIESSKEDMISLQNEKKELETKLKNLAVQLDNTKKEKMAEEILKNEKEKEIQSLKQKLKEKEDLKKKFQNDLEQAKLEARKQGALTLEMRDFEKTISSLTFEITEKQEKIQEINKKLSSCSEANISLKERIKQLEEQVESYVADSKITNEQLRNLNKMVNEYENNVESLELRLKQTVSHLENERKKNENLTLQLASTSAEMETLTELYRSKEKYFNEQIKILQLDSANLSDKSKKKENEFAQLKEDFEAYKIRAHNVLQKLKTENNSKNNEEKLQSEIDVLSHTVKELRKQLDNSLSEIENQNGDINHLKMSKENLLSRIKELSETVKDKSKELDIIRTEHKTYKLNTDTLISCYKSEIEKLKMEKLDYEGKIQSRKEDNCSANENSSVSKNKEANTSESVYTNGPDFNSFKELQEFEIEAIEETERYRKSSKHSLIPLEKLLESDMDERNESDMRTGNEVELRQCIKSLEEQVQYLTKILNESEKNAARNEQQVTFLKEEIRRLQRMFEREPHLQNTEYLKNVLLKFVSLPTGDEKTRLITVLETILKLTPNEKQTLSAIAKGYRVESKQPAGWTSFLGWS